jgi:GNAT superfamily N-acetyltransferase
MELWTRLLHWRRVRNAFVPRLAQSIAEPEAMTTRIRTADTRDLSALAEFGLALAQSHVAFDDRRFVAPKGGIQAYVEFFTAELERRDTVVLIAEIDAAAVGYAFVRMESGSLEALIERAAWLHDVYVDPRFRGNGVGRQLVVAAIDAARRLGSASFMLGVSPANPVARHLYDQLGMRATMVEMRLELD